MISKNMKISDAIKAEENAYHRMVHTIYTEVLLTYLLHFIPPDTLVDKLGSIKNGRSALCFGAWSDEAWQKAG